MAVDTENIIQGPGTLYTGAFGAVEPLDTAVASAPDDAVWTDVGGTTGGVQLNIAQEFAELQVDQVVDRVGRRMTSRDFTVVTNLAEPTLDNLNIVMNGGTLTSGSGYRKLVPTDDTSATQPTYRSIIIDGYAPEQLRRRFVVRKVLSTAGVESSYTKENMTVFPVTLGAHYVSASIKPFAIVDEDAA